MTTDDILKTSRMKITASPAVTNFYTDILAHSFEPGGQRVAAATTMGKFIVFEYEFTSIYMVNSINPN